MSLLRAWVDREWKADLGRYKALVGGAADPPGDPNDLITAREVLALSERNYHAAQEALDTPGLAEFDDNGYPVTSPQQRRHDGPRVDSCSACGNGWRTVVICKQDDMHKLRPTRHRRICAKLFHRRRVHRPLAACSDHVCETSKSPSVLGGSLPVPKKSPSATDSLPASVT